MKQGKLSVAVLLQRAPLKQQISHTEIDLPSLSTGKLEIFPTPKKEEAKKTNGPMTKGSYFQNPFNHLYLLRTHKLPSDTVKEGETLAASASRILRDFGVEHFWILGRKPIALIDESTYVMKAYATAAVDGEWMTSDKVPLDAKNRLILNASI